MSTPEDNAMPTALQVACSGCQAKLRASPQHFGKRMNCPKCGFAVQIPDPRQLAAKDSTTPASEVSRASPPRKNALLIGAVTTAIMIAGLASLPFVFDERDIAPAESPERAVASAEPERDVAPEEQGRSQPEIKPSLHLDEYGYEVSLEVKYPTGQEMSWNGTTVVARALHSETRFMNGVVMPNRWIVVPLDSVEDVERMWVRYKGETFEAQVRRRLEKLGFATLTIERSEKFPMPYCDRSNRMAWNSKDMTILYRDADGTIVAAENCSVVAKKDGREYRILGEDIGDQAIGGIVLHDSGRIAGIVKKRSAKHLILMPWSEVGRGWGEKAGEDGLFNYDTPLPDESPEAVREFHGDFLVQVIVVPKSKKSAKPRKHFLFDTRISSDGVADDSRFANWEMPSQINVASADDFELVETSQHGLRLQSKYPPNSQKWLGPMQLPFLMGSPARLAVHSLADPNTDNWTTSRKVMVKLHDQCWIRDVDGYSRTFEQHFKDDETWEVVTRDTHRLKLRRTLKRYPAALNRRDQFSMEGKEELTVSLKDFFIYQREFTGTFSQTTDDGEKHTAEITFKMGRMNESEREKTSAYWR